MSAKAKSIDKHVDYLRKAFYGKPRAKIISFNGNKIRIARLTVGDICKIACLNNDLGYASLMVIFKSIINNNPKTKITIKDVINYINKNPSNFIPLFGYISGVSKTLKLNKEI
jgi:hypothetical protein